MAELFSYSVKAEPTGSVDFRLNVARFGDGYMQIAGDGIKVVRRSWNLRHFGLKEATPCANLILSKIVSDFLDRNAGKPIQWTDPNGYSAEWVCLSGYTSSEQGNTKTLSFKLEEFN